MNQCSEEGAVGSCHGKEKAEDRSVVSDRSIGSCRRKEKAENRLVRSCVERKRQRIDLLGWIGLLGLAAERKRQRIGLLGLAVERELLSRGAHRGGAGRKVMAEYS